MVIIIKGNVISSETKEGIKGLRVEPWDKELLVSETTDDGGIFRIQIDEASFREFVLDRRPEHFVKIFRGDNLIKHIRDSVLLNVDREEIEMTIEVDKSPTNTTPSPTASRRKVGESELFRFVCRRPFQRVDTNKIENKKARCYEPDGTPSDFHKKLIEAESREAMLDVARNFMEEDPKFVQDLNDLWHPTQPLSVAPPASRSALGFLEEWIFLSKKPIEYSRIYDKIQDVFGDVLAQIQKFSEFQEDRWRLRDSIIALSVDSSYPHKHPDRLIRALRICRIIERMASPAPDPELEQHGGINKAMKAPVLLPPDIFPLPPGKVPEPRAVALELEEKKRQEEEREGLRAKREAIKAAMEELEKLGPSDFAPPPEAPAETEEPVVQPTWKPWTLSEETIERLSDNTREVLKEQHFDLAKDALPEIVNALEKELALTGAKLFQPPEPIRVIRHGDSFLEFRAGIRPLSKAKKVNAVSEPEIPQSAGTVRPVGYGELNVVRQTLLRYEPGEIAHIENVLRGEYKERVHRRLRRIEEEVTVEEERKMVSENDLQSTDRFELKREASETIKEDEQKEAGATLSISYGPVSFSANAGVTSTDAKEQSKNTSVSYAREVTERSVSRLEERVREVRLRRAIEEFEETNTHGIDNKEKDDHAVGVYCWVDKIYQAQIINYGDRLLVEFIVPEPAACYLYALMKNPSGDLVIPEPPRVIDDETGMPCPQGEFPEDYCRALEPCDITSENYQYWTSKYQASEVKVPPIEYKIEHKTLFLKPDKENDPVMLSHLVEELNIPDGYYLVQAYLTGRKKGGGGSSIEIGMDTLIAEDFKKIGVQEPWTHIYDFINDDLLNDDLLVAKYYREGKLPIGAIASGFVAYLIAVAIVYKKRDEHYSQWQQDTYDAIIQAYLLLKTEYEEKLAIAAIQEGISISGRNPAQNREIERTELKKWALSILTAQHFDLFEAMQKDREEYPSIDFGKAETEGSYIQFFEQAFEWPQMTYLFYPYFWGQKDPSCEGFTWLDKITKIQDIDPQFEQFLKAGAARVVVPVRPGYQNALMNFLESNGQEIGQGDEKPHVDDDLYVSIAEEIQLQQGVYVDKTGGTVKVTQGSAEVVGTETDFDKGDIDREIYIEGKRYVIADVKSSTELTLTENYRGESEDFARYYIGAKLVGAPWEVRVPTSLVYLQQDATPLPDFTEESE